MKLLFILYFIGFIDSTVVTAYNDMNVVFWHGLGDHANGGFFVLVKDVIRTKFPNASVFTIKIGETEKEQVYNSIHMPISHQVKMACDQLLNEFKVTNYNAIGISQGGLFLRALIQKCPVKAKTLISIGGPHQGVHGVPKCMIPYLCRVAADKIDHLIYTSRLQNLFTFTNYWHSAVHENLYRKSNVFITDINQENVIKQEYKDRITGLDKMVLIKFDDDDMIIPSISSHFGFFRNGSSTEIIPLNQTTLYNTLGLNILNDLHKIHFITLPGKHLQFASVWIKNEMLKYL